MIAREQAITKKNILAGWSGAGLFPENMDRILKHLINYKDQIISTTSPSQPTTLGPFFLNISPPDPASTHAKLFSLRSQIPTLLVHTKLKSADWVISWSNFKQKRLCTRRN